MIFNKEKCKVFHKEAESNKQYNITAKILHTNLDCIIMQFIGSNSRHSTLLRYYAILSLVLGPPQVKK